MRCYVIFTILFVGFGCITYTQGVRCTDRVRWPLMGCPDGDYWACWNNKEARNSICLAGPWDDGPWGKYHTVEFRTNGILSWSPHITTCHCCGLCDPPSHDRILRSVPDRYRYVAQTYNIDNLDGPLSRFNVHYGK